MVDTDKTIINNFAGKKLGISLGQTLPDFVPNSISKCSYNNQDLYVLSDNSLMDGPAVYIDAASKYLMTCGGLPNPDAQNKTSECSKVTSCTQIYP